uniref:Uncharacterized protein n=1 Tax=Solanum lycopersicum TaxID=4081 RepID=K4BGL4_SOLLC
MAESDVKSSSATTSSASPAYIHPRREPFDRCQLPITKSRLPKLDLSLIPLVVFFTPSLTLLLAKPSEIGSVGVNVFDLVAFLYIKSYKSLGHKDSAVVADVWPSTSAFGWFLYALSPLKVRILFKTLAFS